MILRACGWFSLLLVSGAAVFSSSAAPYVFPPYASRTLPALIHLINAEPPLSTYVVFFFCFVLF